MTPQEIVAQLRQAIAPWRDRIKGPVLADVAADMIDALECALAEARAENEILKFAERNAADADAEVRELKQRISTLELLGIQEGKTALYRMKSERDEARAECELWRDLSERNAAGWHDEVVQLAEANARADAWQAAAALPPPTIEPSSVTDTEKSND